MSDDSTKVNHINVYNNAPAAPEAKAPEAKKGKGKFFTGVLVGGVPGIIIGASGLHGVHKLEAAVKHEIDDFKEDIKDEVKEELAEEGSVVINNDNDNLEEDTSDAVVYEVAPVSQEVDDSMSFGEAFAAARADVGAGGVFTWHGQIYSTYNREEWADMNSSDRSAYAESVASRAISPCRTGSSPGPY